MIRSDLKNKFKNIEKVRGAMIFEFFSPGIPLVLKNSGCEFVIFDMEHGGMSLEQFKNLSIISRASGIYPMIRIPELKYNYIARSLDLGSYGVMIPMVNDEKEADEIVKYSKYPPLGVRGAGFGFAHNDYKNDNPNDLIKAANANLINILQIESKNGLDNVEKIAQVEHVDCLWVGHFDLTNFLGVPGQFESRIYLDAIDRIIKAAKSANKSLGIMVSNREDMVFYDNLGFNIIAVGTEMNFLTQSIKNVIA